MNTLHLSFLGKFQCIYQGDPLTTFRSDKIRALFAYLAIEADTPHRRETLAALFWPENTHSIALRNLRKSLHRLRQTLDACLQGLSEQVLTITRQTVQLNQTAVSVDVRTFARRLADVDTHPHHSLAVCTDCLTALDEAVTLYQGELLAGLSLSDAVMFEEWLLVKREFLHQKVLNALYTLAAAHEKRGDFKQMYAYGLRQTALEPWREEAHRQLMRALARQGERSRALAQYEECRRLLMEELCVQPSLKTVALYEKIEQGLLSDEMEETAVSLHHFPTPSTPFVGRDEEVTAVVGHLLNPACRLLTVIGAGGIGKTRLTLQSVHQLIEEHPAAAGDLFPDGCYFVPLVDAHTSEQLLITIAKAVEITFQASGVPEQQMFNYFANKKLLLVLDNFEQLVGETAVFLSELLQAAPAVQLLISSREALNMQAEWRLRLDGLSYPSASTDDSTPSRAELDKYAAVRLFMQTARRVQPTFRPDEVEQAAIVYICQLTRGVPLALEIAAVWVRMMDCQAIVSQILKNFGFLRTTLRDTPDRHRSMRVVFEQSWQYLSPTERVTLAQLSVFHGGFGLEAAVVVMDDAIHELSALLDKSLLRWGANGRYDLHELLRQFAADKLTTVGETAVQQTIQRYNAYYLHLIAEEKEQIGQIDIDMQWKRARADIDNIRSAWRSAAANSNWVLIAQAVDGLSLFYQLYGLFQEGATVFGAAAAQLEAEIEAGDETKTAVTTLNQLRLHHIHILIAQNKYDETVRLAQRVIDACQWTKNEQQRSLALSEMGIAYWRLHDIERAERYLQEGLDLALPLNIPAQQAYSLHHLGNIAMVQLKHADARPLMEKALALYEASDDLRGLAGLLVDFGSLSLLEGMYDIAALYDRRGAALYQQLNDLAGVALALGNLGYLEIICGDYEAAEADLRQALNTAIDYGLDWMLVNQLNNLGTLAVLQHQYSQAVAWYQQGIHMTGFIEDQLETLYGLTSVIALRGDLNIAAQLLAVKSAIFAKNHFYIFPFEQERNERLIAHLQEGLSAEEWETAVSIGRTLTLEEATALALTYAQRALAEEPD